MGGVDERGEGGLRGCVPFLDRGQSPGVLRYGDDFEVLVLQFFVSSLPPGQIVAAPSPGGPGNNQDLLAPEVGQSHERSFAVGEREIR